jgi:biotin transport system substrate-specific component
MKTQGTVRASALKTTNRTRAAQIAMVGLGSLLMALSAHVAVPLPFTTVPITGQTLALPLVVALLGTRGATLALVLYLAEGIAGLPVFSQYGLRGTSMGYLLAYPAAAFVTGWLFDRGAFATFGGRFAAVLAGTVVVFAGGASWLAVLFGWPVAIATGVVPFLIGDAIKTFLAAAAAPFVRDSGKVVPHL